ncbi:MAG: cupin domain-containing protein [Candidatus Caenarcaniphilales bacterium]|nr:cupin domain-containing protein [Candidatus Caenarcaniphilales bacterium]
MKLYDYDSLRPVSISLLKQLSGVTIIPKTDAKEVITLVTSGEFETFDQIQVDSDTSDDLLDVYSREHYHIFEQNFYVLEGSAIFDILTSSGQWVRIELERHDFMYIPAGVKHRFMSPQKHLKAMYLVPEGATICMELVKEEETICLPLAGRELLVA